MWSRRPPVMSTGYLPGLPGPAERLLRMLTQPRYATGSSYRRASGPGACPSRASYGEVCAKLPSGLRWPEPGRGIGTFGPGHA